MNIPKEYKGRITPSAQDDANLELLRAGVRDFVSRCAGTYDEAGKRLLDVAPQVHEGAGFGFQQCDISTLDIDPDSGADYICDLCVDNSGQIPGGHFDYILCTEVLEHTLQPFDAVAELHRMLKTDGLLFLSVPFNYRIHGPLPDCWRFTEYGLQAMFAKGWEIVDLRSVETPDRPLMPAQYQLIARKIG